uniref:Uncharacterized protein n=1 Tax=viral metagenome TaxID=1070528 RepID=A0A6M3L7N0_9ZZZZ
MTPIENATALLKKDFGDYLGDFHVEVGTTEYGLVSKAKVVTSDGREFEAISKGFDTPDWPKELWRVIANAWLDDPKADKGPERRLKTKQKNPWTRSYLHMPAEISAREEDVRYKLAFGLKE